MRRSELKGEVDGLKKKLATAERREKAALDSQAAVEAKLSFVYKHVEDVSSLVGRLWTRRSEPGDCNTHAPRCSRPLSIRPAGHWAVSVMGTSLARLFPITLLSKFLQQ